MLLYLKFLKKTLIMKKIRYIFLLCFIFSGCNIESNADIIKFAISAEYPPFEFQKNKEFQGFDIELAKMIGEKLDKKVQFENMQFSTIMPAVQNGTVDAAISTITITKERKNNFDFSDSYYKESLSMISAKSQLIENQDQMKDKKIATQLGSTMETWLKENAKNSEIISMDNNNQAIEALKAGHVDGVLVDGVQAVAFSSKNSNLDHVAIAKSENGYGIAFKKGSKLKDEVNKVLKTLKESGEIEKLKKKWIESGEWEN